MGWNFTDGESIASPDDVFPVQGQLTALTLASNQVGAPTVRTEIMIYESHSGCQDTLLPREMVGS